MILAVAVLAFLAVFLAWPGSVARAGRVLRPGAVAWLTLHLGRWSLLGGRRRQARQRSRVRECVADLAAELKAGQSLARAAQRALTQGVAPRTLAATRWGGDVPAALRADADAAGSGLLRAVGACWSVAEGSGAGLALALDRLVEQERRAEEVRVQLQAHLAAPRATARMLAALPLVGIALGAMLGADPIAWFLASPIGGACLAGGLLLTGLGLLWTSRVASSVERLL